MAWSPRHYNGEIYTDPRDELDARVQTALKIGDTHLAVSTSLVQAAMAVRTCDSRTIVNGNRMDRVLVEIQCKKMLDPSTGAHLGMHQNGKHNW